MRCAPDLPAVRVDVAELDVALVNLVANARDALGGRGQIDIAAAPCPPGDVRARRLGVGRGRCVVLTVRDNGPGMTEEVRRRALDPFFSTKGEAGTGLGLAQVHGLLQQVSGEVVLESAPGRGTAVHLYFPVTDAGDTRNAGR